MLGKKAKLSWKSQRSSIQVLSTLNVAPAAIGRDVIDPNLQNKFQSTLPNIQIVTECVFFSIFSKNDFYCKNQSSNLSWFENSRKKNKNNRIYPVY